MSEMTQKSVDTAVAVLVSLENAPVGCTSPIRTEEDRILDGDAMEVTVSEMPERDSALHPDLMLFPGAPASGTDASSGSDSLAELGMNSLTLNRVPVTEQRDRLLMPPPGQIPTETKEQSGEVEPYINRDDGTIVCTDGTTVYMDPTRLGDEDHSADLVDEEFRAALIKKVPTDFLDKAPAAWFYDHLSMAQGIAQNARFRAACASVNRDIREKEREQERVVVLQLTNPESDADTGMETCDEATTNTSFDLALEAAKAKKLESDAAVELQRTRDSIAKREREISEVQEQEKALAEQGKVLAKLKSSLRKEKKKEESRASELSDTAVSDSDRESGTFTTVPKRLRSRKSAADHRAEEERASAIRLEEANVKKATGKKGKGKGKKTPAPAPSSGSDVPMATVPVVVPVVPVKPATADPAAGASTDTVQTVKVVPSKQVSSGAESDSETSEVSSYGEMDMPD